MDIHTASKNGTDVAITDRYRWYSNIKRIKEAPSMQSPPIRIWFVLPIFWFLLQLPAPSAAAHFPTYDVIRPNVAFWIKVYTEYTTRQSIVHDSEDLTIIYDVIDLVPYELPFASKINRRRMKRAKAKYEHILRRLASDPETGDPTYRRVARLFGPGATAKTFRAARARVRCQVGQSDRFKAGLIRSGAYIEEIRAVFRAEHLPEALANLPHVESSFDTKAYSKFGAAGIWQFTRSTGKRFMKVGYVLDERRDPLLATRAAASLLKENYQKLNSWPLAITAYNHGAAGMARAKQSYGDYPTIFASYRSRTFKFASRNFYPEFLAACEVARNYQAYFGELELNRPARFQVVTLDGYAGFDKLCDHYKVPVHVARALNPALRSPVFNGQKLVPRGYPFRLPAQLPLAAIPAELYKEVQKPSRFYTVQRGDTAGRIARTQGVKLTDLILANNLDHRARIFPRQTLRIPLPGENLPHTPTAIPRKPQQTELLAKNEIPTTLAHEPLSKPRADVTTASASVGSDSAPGTIPAAVESANTDNETPPSQDTADAGNAIPHNENLADAGNALQPDEITADADNPLPPGQDTADAGNAIPRNENLADAGSELPPSMEVVSADVRFEKVINNARRPMGIIRAEVEETLGHYAEWAGVRTQQIRRLNGFPFGRTLDLHQKIKIPLTRTTARKFEESRYEYHKRLQEDFFSAYRISDLNPYRVMRGDNLWSLCLEKFDIPMWLLKNCNPEVDFAALHLQQKLLVPIIEKSNGETSADPESDQVQTAAAPVRRASL
jgi:membrane-bound lytic murein transglycosylase D